MSDTTIDKILDEFYGERYCGRCEDYHGLMESDKERVNEAKSALYDLILKEVIGLDNEYHKDMPVPDPDPFALPSDHQNQLRRYQRNKLGELFK